MKRYWLLAALMLLSPSAYADSISFLVGGHRIHVEASRYCRSPSCASVSISGIHRSRDRYDDDDRYEDDRIDSPPVKPQPAPPTVAPPAPADCSREARAVQRHRPCTSRPLPPRQLLLRRRRDRSRRQC